jgi:lysophospholipase L1-like esterase
MALAMRLVRRRHRGLGTLIVIMVVVLAPAPARAESLPLPNSIVAAGDSITRAFDAGIDCILRDCPQYSWSTGDSGRVISHYRRILAANPRIAGQNYSLARSGARVADLQYMLHYAGFYKADYVTVLIGANDVCTSSIPTMTSTVTFYQEFAAAVGDYFEQNPSGHIFVASIPDIYQLWAVMHTNADAANHWKLFGICQSMLATSNSEADRQVVAHQAAVDNYILATVCQYFRNCRWDGYAVFNYKFPAADVSTIDYFHPNVSGENDIADVTWRASYWGG